MVVKVRIHKCPRCGVDYMKYYQDEGGFTRCLCGEKIAIESRGPFGIESGSTLGAIVRLLLLMAVIGAIGFLVWILRSAGNDLLK